MSIAFELYKIRITSAKGDERSTVNIMHQAACDRSLSLTEYAILQYIAKESMKRGETP